MIGQQLSLRFHYYKTYSTNLLIKSQLIFGMILLNRWSQLIRAFSSIGNKEAYTKSATGVGTSNSRPFRPITPIIDSISVLRPDSTSSCMDGLMCGPELSMNSSDFATTSSSSAMPWRSEEHTSELQSQSNLV